MKVCGHMREVSQSTAGLRRGLRLRTTTPLLPQRAWTQEKEQSRTVAPQRVLDNLVQDVDGLLERRFGVHGKDAGGDRAVAAPQALPSRVAVGRRRDAVCGRFGPVLLRARRCSLFGVHAVGGLIRACCRAALPRQRSALAVVLEQELSSQLVGLRVLARPSTADACGQGRDMGSGPTGRKAGAMRPARRRLGGSSRSLHVAGSAAARAACKRQARRPLAQPASGSRPDCRRGGPLRGLSQPAHAHQRGSCPAWQRGSCRAARAAGPTKRPPRRD